MSETPCTPERLKLLEQLFEEIATEFEVEFDHTTTPEVILAGLRRILKATDLGKLQRMRELDGIKNLEQAIRHISLAEGYYRRTLE